ncbi:sensor histidine kinase [Aliikangiella coralliicola]|nr:HAMP domain-containing sensor histidine kinase [Aliikangiella coralliicola]
MVGIITAVVYSLIDFGSIQYLKYEIENKNNYQEALILSEIYDSIENLSRHQTESFLLFRKKRNTNSEIIPKELQTVENNLDEVIFQDKYYELVIVERDQYIYYFLFDIEAIKKTEFFSYLSLAFGLSISLIAALLISLKLSGEVVKPLKKLTIAIKKMKDSDDIMAANDESENSKIKELNYLLSSFHQYDSALKNVIKRERSFSAHMSHEFRTPLSVIMGAIELLEQEQEPQSQRNRQLIRRLSNEVNQLRDISEMMLLITRADADINSEITCSEVSLEVLVRGVISSIESQYKNSMGRIDFRVNNNPYTVCWTIALSVMVRNIIQNALTHSEDAHVEVYLTDSYIEVRNQLKQHSELFAEAKGDEFNCGIGLKLCQTLASSQGMRLEIKEVKATELMSVALYFQPELISDD